MDAQRLVPRERSIIAQAESQMKMLVISPVFKHISSCRNNPLSRCWLKENVNRIALSLNENFHQISNVEKQAVEILEQEAQVVLATDRQPFWPTVFLALCNSITLEYKCWLEISYVRMQKCIT